MPKVGKYLKEFDLKKGLSMSGYTLSDIHVGHVSIKRYKKYQYPSILTWKKIDSSATSQKLLNSLSDYLGKNMTIYTFHGNPYSCDFGQLEINHEDDMFVIIEATGECDRV
uniref:Uncharacterized protein n=1 Tax=Pithovirus LCPAC401 TaxID=2506595 RepID=A0A481ZBH9_9VIRU|nr:MAG: uncharacterized protein LCPAC401_01480 [Pithovirus LCPAC401]